MAFADETPVSSPHTSLSLNRINNIHMILKNCKDTSIANTPRFCKTCCKPCHRICPRTLAEYKAQLKARQGRSDNFIFISTRCIVEFCRWTNECLSTHDFLRSTVMSAILFAIGVKLTGELDACKLSRTVGR